MNTTHTASPVPSTAARALVLGGGGSAGNAWLIGVAAGLAEGGLDVRTADLVVGTSAGSTAAAQLAGAPAAELLAATVAPPPAAAAPAVPAPGAVRAGSWVADHLARTDRLIAESADHADMRRRIGADAIERTLAEERSGADPSARWRGIVAQRFPGPAWPDRRILITAVDASTGDPVVFDRASGVELVDAVAASCSASAAYRIGDRLFIDGGYRTNAENADLAAGSERVLVLSPFGGATRAPREWGIDLAAQVDALRAGGSRAEVIVPDEAARVAFGDNAMDPASRPPAARAGFAQGRALAPALAEFWG